MELLAEAPGLEAMVACTGGGGLLGGCCVAAKGINPAIRMFGAEPELADDVWQSLQKGERVSIPPSLTIADGLRTPSPGKLTFPILQQHVEQIALISEDEIRATVRFCLERLKIVVEPSGAVGVAAALFGKLPADVTTVGIVSSGGNVDLDQLAEICR